MSKGILKLIKDGVVREINDKTTADLVKYNNNGTDTTVADFLSNISAGTAEYADVAEKAEKDLSGNVITETYAPIDSPNFTGTPTAPTSDDLDLLTNQVATVAWCNNVFKRFTGIVPENMDTLQEFWEALGEDSDLATTLATELATKQDKTDKLTAFSNLTLSADDLILATGANTFSTTTLTSTGRIFISSSAKDIRKVLGVYRQLVLDDVETNRWIVDGDTVPTISNVNAKFDRALQLNRNRSALPSIVVGGSNFSIDFWGYFDPACPDTGVIMSLETSALTTDGVIYICRDGTNNGIAVAVYATDGTDIFRDVLSNVSAVGSLNHYEIDYNHATQNFKFFVNGEMKINRNSVTIDAIDRWILLGNFFVGNATFPFAGAISEFRVSNCIRHDSDFQAALPTAKYEVDGNTLSLLHFD